VVAKYDVNENLGTLAPAVRPGRWVLVFFDRQPPFDLKLAASIQEAEGLAAVIAQAEADRLGLQYDEVLGWIECSNTSPTSVAKLTGALIAALSAASISCHSISGVRHDHLFVPIAQREDALAALDEMSLGRRGTRPERSAGLASGDLTEVRTDDGEIRLGQFLKLAGLADSGAAVKPLLAYGRVKVNNETESRRGRQLHLGDVVTVDGRSVAVG
jgi:ribosome-associated protein YbcJ (S4-like RNA binding protein)